jgi:hypothetical protein
MPDLRRLLFPVVRFDVPAGTVGGRLPLQIHNLAPRKVKPQQKGVYAEFRSVPEGAIGDVSAFQALVISTLAVLPGALFTFAYERQTHIVRAALADRVLRLTASSAVFYLVFAPLVYWIYLDYVRSGRLARGPLPWGLWLAPLLLIVGPLATGALLGAATRRGQRWARLLSGQSPEPRAWDALFGRGYRRSAWLRIRLKDAAAGADGWLLGVFAPKRGELPSFAAGYPDAPDLYLSDTAEAEPGTGKFLLQDGKPRMRGVGLWIGWEQIAYIEVMWEGQSWETEPAPADPAIPAS